MLFGRRPSDEGLLNVQMNQARSRWLKIPRAAGLLLVRRCRAPCGRRLTCMRILLKNTSKDKIGRSS